MVDIGCTDQREILLIGDRENYATVGLLKNIGAVMVKQLTRYNVASSNQPDSILGCLVQTPGQYLTDPRATAVYDGLCLSRSAFTCLLIPQLDLPKFADTRGRFNPSSGPNCGTPSFRIAGVQDHETRVFDPAIGVLKSLDEIALQGLPCDMSGQIQRLCGR